MNISQRLRTCAKHTGLDAVIELLQEAADEIDALQARAQVQGEPFGYIHHFAAHDESGALIDTTWEADGCADPLPHPTFPAMWKWSQSTPFYTTPQPAQVQGELEPYDAGILNDFGGGNVEWWQDYIRAELGRAHDFYQSQIATPQPAQATQAEVADGIRPEDFTVDVVVKPMGGFAPVNTQGVRVTHKPTGISVTCDAARSQHTNRHQAFEKLSAILALRPERVPMTHASRDVIMATRTANADADEWPEPWAYQRGWNDAEAHHGITAQAKKETP